MIHESVLFTLKIDEADEFDTTITGPWIGRWPITNENKHTQAFRHVTGAKA